MRIAHGCTSSPQHQTSPQGARQKRSRSRFLGGMKDSMPHFAFRGKLLKVAEPGFFARRTKVSVMTGVVPAPG